MGHLRAPVVPWGNNAGIPPEFMQPVGVMLNSFTRVLQFPESYCWDDKDEVTLLVLSFKEEGKFDEYRTEVEVIYRNIARLLPEEVKAFVACR